MTIKSTKMDEFGVLAERFGYKPRHNSAPLAQLKFKSQTNPNGCVSPMPDFVVFDPDDIFYTQKKTTGPSGIPDLMTYFTNSSYTAHEDLFPSGFNADDPFHGFGISRTPTNDRRSGVNVSQPSSSPVDDLFSVPQPPADAYWLFTESDSLLPKTEPVSGGQKPASSTSVPKDFISFEDDVCTSGASKDKDGESDEQRRRGLNSHMRIQERVANALAEKRQRDVLILQEQEERSRLADTLDNKIKRWASGKEGDLRALLSSLQDVLWPQSGWQMALSGDLIESRSVTKVYKRAIVYLHPDKANQNGFSPEEKYIAENVFYVLKEAYKVFQAQELR